MKNKKASKEKIRSFTIDNRANPGLHNLYVGYAEHVLSIVAEAAQRLEDCSQVTAFLLAGTIRNEIQRLVSEDAAYFEAAALLFARLSPPERNT